MFIKIPVFWAPDDYEEKEACGVKFKYSLDDLVVNTDQICAYHANDDGETVIKLSNGESYRSPVDFKEFAVRFPELMTTFDLVISGDN